MTFEERLRAAIEERTCAEILEIYEPGINKVYQAVDNILIRLAKNSNDVNLYLKDNQRIIINGTNIKTGIIESYQVYLTACGYEIVEPMTAKRLMYYIQSNHEYEKGIEITQYTERGDGVGNYPGLQIKFLHNKLITSLKDRINKVKECIGVINTNGYKKAISFSLQQIIEKLDDEILKYVAARKDKAAIFIYRNKILIKPENAACKNPDESAIEYEGYGIEIPKEMPKRPEKEDWWDNLISEQIIQELGEYYKGEGLKVQSDTLSDLPKNVTKLVVEL